MDSLEHSQIEKAIDNLHSKLHKLNLNHLNITDYNKEYLQKYIANYSFYMSLYSQLLQKAIKKLKKPISESIFVDYGGGVGILSYLASEIGFKSVIYNDIYQKSVDDVKVLSRELGMKMDAYICGDVDQFVEKTNSNNIRPDLICSFDVLEHIYDLEKWIISIANIHSKFSLLFMTSANSRNPYVNNRLKKLQRKAEYEGFNKTIGWKETDLNSSFLEARKNIIRKKFPQFKDNEIKELSSKTRGLKKDDIEEVVQNYIKKNVINYHISHPTNTCDPYTGNRTENLIDLKRLKKIIRKNNLKVNITNSFYSNSNNKIFNVPKQLLNLVIKILGSKNLFFSPTYTLEIQKD